MWLRQRSNSKPVELLGLADNDLKARAEAYAQITHDYSEMGELDLADIFADLAKQSLSLLPSTCSDGASGIPFHSSHSMRNFAVSAETCRTAYDAWALAVNVEDETEKRLISLLIQAEDPNLKQQLVDRILESRDRAAGCRMHRRAAYHSEKIEAVRASFPDRRRIHSDTDLALVALAIERWYLRLLLQPQRTASQGYQDAIEKTRDGIERLESLTKSVSVPRRISKWLDILNGLPDEKRIVRCSGRFFNLKLTAEAGRIFDYYDRTFEEADNVEVLALAQLLSAGAVRRLQSLRTRAFEDVSRV
ncbi:MAG: hypothetical protein KDJ17_02445 [Hyphomicrobiaceae bacterium]|nr:hypothetical protein [Hyphomicrobiaceae bacterium]